VVRRHASDGARRFSMSVGLMLPRRAFLPPPRVDSAVLVVRRRR
jgi:23S rRNA (adenine-N6)-dimethyltransferase